MHTAFSFKRRHGVPGLSISRILPAGFLVHASYDRVFQTPAVENLLLASSPQVVSLDPVAVRLPVRPARADYYEVGMTKSLFGKLRIDANVFRRDFRNYADDDTLLDTGISFPIAFAKGQVTGEEIRLSLPSWGRFSGFASYGNQVGWAQGPITGGLFLGSEGIASIADRNRFPVSQDQRNTVRARLCVQTSRRSWIAVGAEYGSGLPVESEEINPAFLLQQYGLKILQQVDLARGRVRPNQSLDVASGIDLYKKEMQTASLEASVDNLTDRMNVINFAGLFSGTAVAAPRSYALRLRFAF